MKNTIVHHEGAASLEAVASKVKPRGAQIKIGLDMHARVYVAVAQYDHLLPKAARRLSPNEFVPWVEALLDQGHSVHVVYEACGFGFSLYRQLIAVGALLLCHCSTQTGRTIQPGEDRSARRDHAVSASFPLPGRQHA
jgi:hypothetical protein